MASYWRTKFVLETDRPEETKAKRRTILSDMYRGSLRHLENTPAPAASTFLMSLDNNKNYAIPHIDNWAAATKLREYYLKETERRKAEGLPTY